MITCNFKLFFVSEFVVQCLRAGRCLVLKNLRGK